MSSVHDHPDEHGPGAPCVVQLLLERPVTLDTARLLATLTKILGPTEQTETGERLVVSFPELISKLPEGDLPAQGVLVAGPIHRPEEVQAALSQTWDWPEAGEALQRATSALVVSDLLASGLPRGDRLRLLHGLVRAALEQVQPLAIHWQSSMRLVDPAFYVHSLEHGAGLGDAPVNVRLFRVPDGRPGECVMDTLGLAPFGLPDLQMHFVQLDPGAVAPVLLSYAEYLFEKGDVLNDDSLVRGVESSQEWACHRERSLAAPVRDVIDIVPEGYAVQHR